jgi:hypothetical protein
VPESSPPARAKTKQKGASFVRKTAVCASGKKEGSFLQTIRPHGQGFRDAFLIASALPKE